MRRFCSLLSGGKDSNYALYKALSRGWKPSCILVVRPEREDSWMFHTALLDAPRLQVEAMGLTRFLVEARVSGVKEREVEELERILSELFRERGFDVIVVGAVASRYQRERVERIAGRLGVDVYSPAWGADPYDYMRKLVAEGFRFVITRAAAMGLHPGLVGVVVEGRVLDEILERARRYGFHPAFEGGEAETLVVDAPHYAKSLCLKGRVAARPGGVYELEVEALWLASKGFRSGCLSVENPYAGRLGVRLPDEPLRV
jgi:ABC transporter with metal-binding/Fe-S-binding domain ATP-binding protein